MKTVECGIPDDKVEDQSSETKAWQLLPKRSKERYEQAYAQFCKWRENGNVDSVSDEVFLDYIKELSMGLKATTLWSKYSMIKCCLTALENVDVDQFPKTTAFIKERNKGYTPNRSEVLSAEEVTRFLMEAEDDEHLVDKVMLIFTIFGSLAQGDLVQLTIDDVEDNFRYLTVFLRDNKQLKNRSFVISDEGCAFAPCNTVRRYIALRPENAECSRFFIAYRNGKCVAQNVGIHKIGTLPKRVAKFLNLPKPERYTGHSLKKTSAFL